MPRRAAVALTALLAGCQPAGVPGATALRSSWMFGIERMRGDVEPQLPYTNRFIAELAAMPSVQVVYVGDERGGHAFSAWGGSKLLVSPWLHGESNCMNITYTIFEAGQQQGVFGLAVARMPAGIEPDPACVDRAAAEFYRTLVVQGL